MRGTVLLLAEASYAPYTEYLRASGLLVYEGTRPEDADTVAPDVVVTAFTRNGQPSLIRELRDRIDYATSIIVIAGTSKAAAYAAGADSVLPISVLPGEVLYEVQRALILRRSGRRLPRQV